AASTSRPWAIRRRADTTNPSAGYAALELTRTPDAAGATATQKLQPLQLLTKGRRPRRGRAGAAGQPAYFAASSSETSSFEYTCWTSSSSFRASSSFIRVPTWSPLIGTVALGRQTMAVDFGSPSTLDMASATSFRSSNAVQMVWPAASS